jgi:hypothetical protein
MKIKSLISKWAVALCAVAAFSFTAILDTQARPIIPEPAPAITIAPTPERPPIEPLPPVTPPSESPLPTGTFTGTVIAD